MAETSTNGLPGRLAKKLLMPLVATGVTAAASYAGRKAPELLEERLMPKLREASAPKPAPPSVAKEDAEEPQQIVASSDDKPKKPDHGSTAELERRREERAAHRSARRNRQRS